EVGRPLLRSGPRVNRDEAHVIAGAAEHEGKRETGSSRAVAVLQMRDGLRTEGALPERDGESGTHRAHHLASRIHQGSTFRLLALHERQTRPYSSGMGSPQNVHGVSPAKGSLDRPGARPA